MAKLQIIPVGTKFNRLTYIGEAEKTWVNKKAIRRCLFVCDCGNKREVKLSLVKDNSVMSCGCWNQEVRSKKTAERNFRHGVAKINGKKNPTYVVFINMMKRCYNENHVSFHHYGGRGIEVCDDWRNNPVAFHDWCMSNGYSKGLQIDRIDNNGNYEPANCKFVTPTVNGNNKRNNRILQYKGKDYTVSELAELAGIKWNTLRGRIDYQKWDVVKAVETPVDIRHRNGRYKGI